MRTVRRWSASTLLAALVVAGALFAAGPASAYPAGTAPTIGVGSGSVRQGGSVTVSGAHYHPNSTVTIVIESTPTVLGTVRTGPDGTFSTSVTIPPGFQTGVHTITGTDTQDESATTSLEVTDGSGTGGVVVSNPNPGEGGSMTVSGSGCVAGATITVSLDDGRWELGSTTADASGAYSLQVTMPAGVTGRHLLTVDGAGCSGVLGVEITAGSGDGDLAGTGVAVIGLGALGVVLLVGGGLMLLAGRRRRSTAV